MNEQGRYMPTSEDLGNLLRIARIKFNESHEIMEYIAGTAVNLPLKDVQSFINKFPAGGLTLLQAYMAWKSKQDEKGNINNTFINFVQSFTGDT